MKDVDVTAPGKLIGLCAVIVGCFAVLIVSIIVQAGSEIYSPVLALLTLVVGYLVGNGTGAKAGQVSVPPFTPKPLRQAEYLARIMEEDLPFKERDRIQRLIQRTREAEEG